MPEAAPDNHPVSTGSDPQVEIERLISLGKCKQAVELAKEEHKRRPTAHSERTLFRAYVARIDQFQNKGMHKEAQSLLNLARQRFPQQRAGLAAQAIRLAAAEGRIEELVAPLAGATPELSAQIETSIRGHLIDVAGLAATNALPADHPLRIAASAICRAFEAVTNGAVTEQLIALPEVSHRSPLAAWKLLVRAIAAFYRNDDQGCRRALDAMPADAAASRLAPVLRAMIAGTPLTGAAGSLQAHVVPDDRPLRTALERIENAFQWTDLPRLKSSIRTAVSACASTRPVLLERLRQHISVACAVQGVPADEVLKAMGPALKDAYFWRLLARASEVEGAVAVAAMYWERFMRHAAAEGLFSNCSPEAGQVWLHMAELLSNVPQPQLQRLRKRLGEGSVFADYYRGQPAQIAALAPPSDKEVVRIALNPAGLFERAVEIDPAPETCRLWWAWAQNVALPDRAREDLAQRWHEKRPADPQPLLALSELAEKRNALKLALTHLSAAEALDALDPRVRQARIRLTLATTWRHFRAAKPHLVEKDLAELTALPGMDQGDRAAFVVALRAAWHALQDDAAGAQTQASRVIEQAGALAGIVILESAAGMAQVARRPAWPQPAIAALQDPHEVAHADARTIGLTAELGVRRILPAQWGPVIDDVLREPSCPLSQGELLLIGRCAVQNGAEARGYLASSAGLPAARDPAGMARFLLLRAQSLSAPWARCRAAQCLAAALELARQTHDAQLIDEIFAQIDGSPGGRAAVASNEAGGRLGEQGLAEVLKHERVASSAPRNAAEADRHLAPAWADLMEANGFAAEPFGEPGVDDEAPFDEPRSGPFGALDGGGLLDEDLQELVDLARRNGGRLPSPGQMLDSNPQLVVKLLAALGGGEMPGIDDLLDPPIDPPGPGIFDRIFGRRKHKHKKRR